MSGFRIKKAFLLIGAFLSISSICFGQKQEIRFEKFPEELAIAKGIGAYEIFQDSKGYIWIGSFIGLIRYDGYEEKRFVHEPTDSLSISDSKISEILEDPKGYLWILTQNGLNRFDPKTEHFERIYHESKAESAYGKNYCLPLVIRDNYLWLWTERGVCKYDLEKEAFDHVHHTPNNQGKAVIDTIDYSFVAQNKDLYLTKEDGFYVYNTDNEDFDFKALQFKRRTKEGKLEGFYYFMENPDGQIWIGTDEALQLYHPKTKKLAIVNKRPEYHEPIRSQGHGLYLKDKNGLDWVGTANGLYVFNHQNESVINLKHDRNDLTSINNNVINTGLEDSDGNIWIATQGGVNIYNPNRKKFNSIPTDIESTPLFIREMFEIESGKLLLWENGQLNEIKYRAGKRNPFPYTPTDNLAQWNTGIVCYYQDTKGKIWMGMNGGDVFIYDPKTYFYEHLPLPNPTLQSQAKGHMIGDLMEDAYNNIWISTWGGGLFRYQPKTKVIKRFAHNPDNPNGLISNHVRILYVDQSDDLWVSTRAGLEKFDYDTETFTHYVHELDNPNSISENTAFSIYESPEGDFWVGTYGGGLNKMDREKGTFEHYTIKDGLSDNNVVAIYPTKDGSLWLHTLKGLNKFNLKTKEIQNFNDSDGLINKGHSAFAHFQSPYSGEVFIEGEKGIDYYHPDSIKLNPIPPKIIISNLKLNNETVKIAQTAAEKNSKTEFFLGSHISHTQQLSIPPNKKVITFGFTAIHFESPENNEYAYQLVGFDKGWQKVGTKREATYTNLDPGRYTFKVKAANADGIWNETPAEITLIILPPWWLTWWAKLGYALTGIGALLWFVWLNRQKVKKKEAELAKERAYSQKLAKINRANQRFVPQDVLKILGKKSIEELKLGDQVQTKMTILFSDIRAYTSLSETMSPADNFKFINGYLGRVGPIIEKHGGFISQYFGDGLMALFLDNAENATHAAIEIQKTLQQYNRHRNTKRRSAIQTGIGLNTGQLMLGIIGDKNRYESTVIADAVNTASRMEGLTKIFGAAIILSEKTLIDLIKMEDNKQTSSSQKSKFSQLTIGDIAKMSPPSNPPFFAYRYLGKVKVKGREKALKIYDLYEGEIPTIRQLKAKTRPVFEKGIQLYFNKKFGKAADCFKEVLRDYPKDKAAQYYLDKSVNFIVHGVTENWSGVEEMVMK